MLDLSIQQYFLNFEYRLVFVNLQ